MAKVERFEDLNVWQEARSFALKIFEITHSDDFPRDFGFINQVNNAAGSIMDNITEGFERGAAKSLSNFFVLLKAQPVKFALSYTADKTGSILPHPPAKNS